MTRLPPALVEMLPPMAQEPRAPRSSGTKKPASSAACCTRSSGVPAWTVIVAVAESISSTPIIRSSESATSLSLARPPPHRPVSPPWGTTGWRWAWQTRSAVATSAVVRGRTTASGWVGGRPLQSSRVRSGMSPPVSTTSAPSSARSATTTWPAMVSPSVLVLRQGRLLGGCGLLLVARLPLVVGHAVDQLAGLGVRQLDAARLRRLAVPAAEAVPAEAGEVHQVDVLDLGPLAQVLDQRAEGRGLELGAGLLVVGGRHRVLLPQGVGCRSRWARGGQNRRADVLGADADADQPGRQAAQAREAREELEGERRLE